MPIADKYADVIIIGGGAAGFFTAINLAERCPTLKIILLEKSNKLLTKVRISGGGRCNVTHAEFEPKRLVQNYPRGKKELLGPFHTFMTNDTIDWFEQRDVKLKTEKDGRVFPQSDSSQTIIDCFLEAVKKLNIEVMTSQRLEDIQFENEQWNILTNKQKFIAKDVVIATGSDVKIWQMIEKLGHQIIQPVPSLFTFNIKDNRIDELMGLSSKVSITIEGTKFQEKGNLLITHWGISGPAVLKLSSWAALQLNSLNYKFNIKINWCPNYSYHTVVEELIKQKNLLIKKSIKDNNPFEIPKRLWHRLLMISAIANSQKWADLSKKQLEHLARQLTEAVFEVDGKSTFKNEFVTAGGISLDEINFQNYCSKIYPSLYFAGEVVNIDALTGGFNFQNAWTSGYLVAQAIAKKLNFSN